MKINSIIGLLFIILFSPAASAPGSDEASLEAAARALHTRILTVDTHCDTPGAMLRPGWDIGARHAPDGERGDMIDLPRMKDGGLDALFFGVFTAQGPLTPDGYAKARSRAMSQIEAVEAMCSRYPGLVGKATTPADALRLKKEGKRAAFIGVENGYPIGEDFSFVGTLAAHGARSITLCHSADNQICDSGTDRRNPEDRGLSEFGRRVVAECNRRGIMIDVSHISDKSFVDVLAATKVPVLASHSCCRALCDNPRNLTDDMIRGLAKNGGVLQICFLGDYLVAPKPNPERDAAFKALETKFGSWGEMDEAKRAEAAAAYRKLAAEYPEAPAYVKDVVDHFDHVIGLVGEDYVGVGTDFDGGGGLADCRDVSQMYRVTMEMLRRGYSESRIAKIWGGNVFRVLQKVIDAADPSL